MDQPSPATAAAPFDWERCIREARAGSADALGRLLEVSRPFLLNIAAAELAPDLRAKASASDIVQDTCCDAQRGFPTFSGAGEVEVRAWLRQVLLNNLGDFRRRFRDAERRAVGREASLEEANAGRQAQELADDTPSPSSYARRREEAVLVEAALANLPEHYRQVIYLHHRDRLSFAEVGRRMGRSEAAVQKLWERAVEQLRLALKGKA